MTKSLLAVAFLSCSAAFAANQLTEQEQAEGWKLLFDGKSTKGWRNYKSQGVRAGWKVEDGHLTHLKNGGDIMTEAQYDDFILKLDWQVAENGNSGIFFGVRETKGPIYFSGIEMQIIDNERHPDAKIEKHTSGSCYGLYKPPAGAAKKAGEWNQVKVVKKGPHYQFFLNGVKTADFSLEDTNFINRVANSKFAKWTHFARYRKGHIGLQDHGDIVRFRNMKILELSSGKGNQHAEVPPEDWAKWANWVDQQISANDGHGHGPDVGTDEWASSIDSLLKISDAAGHGPEIKSKEWRSAVEHKLKQRRK